MTTPQSETTLGYKVNYKPRWHQYQAHAPIAYTKVLACHRRFGKTIWLQNEAIKVLTACPLAYPQGIIVYPTQKQAKRVAWPTLKRLCRTFPNYKANESELSVEFLDCKIYLVGAKNVDAERGMYLDFAAIDELDDVDIDIYESVILPALVERMGSAVLAGTPKGRGNLYNTIEAIKDRGDPNEIFFIYKASETGILKPEVMERLRNSMTAAKWQREMEMSFDDAEGALWVRSDIIYKKTIPSFVRIVVAIDPAVTHGEKSDETGIIVAGLCGHGYFWVLDDLSGRFKPSEWAKIAVEAYTQYGADCMVAEVNQGGDLVRSLVQQAMHEAKVDGIKYKKIHARRGKVLRAEPVAALYENKKVMHAKQFAVLENQLCTWQPDDAKSPDRMDALVYALTELAKLNYDTNKQKGKGWKGDDRPDN